MKAFRYTKLNKNGIVTYKLGQVQRHLLNKHKDLDCCQAFFTKNENSIDEKKKRFRLQWQPRTWMNQVQISKSLDRSVCHEFIFVIICFCYSLIRSYLCFFPDIMSFFCYRFLKKSSSKILQQQKLPNSFPWKDRAL